MANTAHITNTAKNPDHWQCWMMKPMGQPDSAAPKYPNKPTKPVAVPAASRWVSSAAAIPINICGPKTKKPMTKINPAAMPKLFGGKKYNPRIAIKHNRL